MYADRSDILQVHGLIDKEIRDGAESFIRNEVR